MTEFESEVWLLWRDRVDTALIAATLTRDGFFMDENKRTPVTEAHVYNTLSRLRERHRAGKVAA